MTKLQRFGFTMVLSTSSMMASTAFGRQPPAATDPATPDTNPPAATVATISPAKLAAMDTAALLARKQVRNSRRSIVHHYQYPYPSHYLRDENAGFRNPGGVGTYRSGAWLDHQYELNTGSPRLTAGFDQGGGFPSREEQMEAQQIGVQKQNAIQNHIDNYSRPYIGYGVGYFGGFY